MDQRQWQCEIKTNLCSDGSSKTLLSVTISSVLKMILTFGRYDSIVQVSNLFILLIKEEPVLCPESEGGPWVVQLLRSITIDSAIMDEVRIKPFFKISIFPRIEQKRSTCSRSMEDWSTTRICVNMSTSSETHNPSSTLRTSISSGLPTPGLTTKTLWHLMLYRGRSHRR